MPSVAPCNKTVYCIEGLLPPNNLVEESEEWEKKGENEKKVKECINELWEKGNHG